MDQHLKQSAGSVTVSEHKLFFKARIKLTALYVLIVAIIVFGFSIFLYQSIEKNLTDASDDDFADTGSHQHFVQHTLDSVQSDLILADIFILIVTAGFSFVLAGKTLKPIQQSVEAQKAFASNASHELRTPLAVMRNDIEVYLRNNSPTKEITHGTMKSNLEEIKHMSGIVEDLLLLARSDNQTIRERKDIDINDLLKKMLERMNSLANTKNVKLTYTPSGPFTIKGVQKSLERVILNILQNSIDHTPNGGSIITKVEKDGLQVVIYITDTGSGIAPEKLPHIFKRFYKGDSANGTGLGLSIVKGIVDQHGGDVSVESGLGKGTTVIVKLPIT
jgi:signal transduction histidine kinase